LENVTNNATKISAEIRVNSHHQMTGT